MPHDRDAANAMVAANLDGADARSIVRATSMRRVRRATNIGQAVAAGGRSWKASEASTLIGPMMMSPSHERIPEYEEPTWRGVAVPLIAIAVMALLMLILL
jgi:hypothetical protein